MKQLILFFSFLVLSITLIAQNYIYKGNKQFIATRTWIFDLTKYDWHNEGFEVTVAKTTSGGYMMLSIEVPFEESISGNLFIILETGKTLTLTTRISSDHVDSKTQVLYVVTKAQIELLKTAIISKIRFTLRNKGIGGMNGNYTATNFPKTVMNTDILGKSEQKIIVENTAKDISDLFSEE